VPTEYTNNVIAFSGNTMVYESVKRFAVKGLNDLIRILMESVDDALFELSEKVESDHDRNMYFEAMREIRLKRKLILEKFDDELQESFNRLIINKAVSKKSNSLDELSLVDQQDLEDSLAIDNMISKARPHFEDDLFAVVERFKIILHRKQVTDDQNPLDPKAICDSFHHASEVLDTDIQVKLIFYKLFDKFVMSNLGHFYRELNDYFIQKGVLPEFKASQERMKQTTKFMANRISRSYSEEQLDNSEFELKLNEQSSSSDNVNQPQVDGNLLSLLQQVLTPGGGVPAMQTGSIEMSMLQNAETGDNVESLPVVGLTPAAQNTAYMSALTNLQSNNMLSQSVGSVDPQNLKTQLNQQLVAFKQDNSQQSSAADNQIIDIVSMLFDFFFDDEALPDPIKVLIGRLQIPILKVAILDSSFFNHKKHPARQLLDSISKASLGWSDDQQLEDILIKKLEKIVDFLLLEFDQDIAIFEQALDEFQQFLKDENDKIDQAVEQLKQIEKENDQQIEEAQVAASAFIQKLLEKHELSFDVIDFLDGIWKSVLYHTYLSQGESSNHWKNVKRLTTTLIWTLIAKHSESDKKKLLKTLPSLLRALSQGMELIKVDADGKNSVFQMLVLEHAKVVKQTSKNLVTRVDDETVWPEKNMEAAFSSFNEKEQDDSSIDILLSTDDTGEIQIIENEPEIDKTKDTVTEITVSETQEVIHNLNEFTDCVVNGNIHIEEEIIMDSAPGMAFMEEMDTDDFLETVQNLEPGVWLEFVETGSKSLHAKLSWKSKITGKYVFVNRQGHKIKNMTSFGLAAEFRAGTAKLIESVSVFDRAINSFMSTIRH
jgi:hypothetical protein